MYTPTGTDGTKEHQSLFSYDAEHRLTAISQQLCTLAGGHACSSTSATGSTTYAYDDNDNRTTVNESNGSASSDRRYCYDARNQPTYRNTGAACSAGANDEAYSYDDAGNRLSAAGRSFAYSAEGQLTSCSSPSCTVSYDSAGRTATLTDNGSSWTYQYDAAGRLVTACKGTACGGSVDTVVFTYDGEGHRTKIVATPAAGSPVTTTDFRYHGGAVVAEVVNGTLTREFVTNDAGTIQKVIVPSGQTDAGTYLVVWNGHGDATGLWRMNGDGTLTLANSYTYGTWGAPTTATHNSIGDLGFRYLYVGAFDVQWDDAFGLGLLYMHARHYSPALGRFLQPDPARAEANGYGYAANSPTSKVDPSGLYLRTVFYKSWKNDQVILDIFNGLAGAACWALGNPIKHPAAAGLLGIACAIGAGRLSPKTGELTTYTVYTNSYYPNRAYVVNGLYHIFSSGYLTSLAKSTHVYAKTTRCWDYLLYRTGFIGLTRLPVSCYCLPPVI
ncbi:MAG: RHS repeat-associated core domain-containing protein [Chloroflexota bacterium]